ncbi:MAG TPA: peptide MFS transporter [Thermoanaerobaculia bacterium]|nr:peptide MFS transporter [Thermoanaerobaculia bacterium]
MTSQAAAVVAHPAPTRHPRGLYVLFATELWERFSFYTMLALFTLYLQDKTQGFGWTDAQATTLRANYLGFVFFSPIVGGWLADRYLGYRRAVMIGGGFFIAGHVLLAFPSIGVVYAALVCLVIGNGLFKPNVSTIVGNLYPKDSPLRDRAYNIFYMGINLGATVGPIVVEFVHARWGFHPAFAVAAGGMVISVLTLVVFRKDVEPGDRQPGSKRVDVEDAGPPTAIDAVPEGRRIFALIVVYLVSIVFWMLFFQNGSTLTYWANDNTNWNFSGIISNAIEPFFVIAFSIPLVMLWKALDRRGLEPATTTKIVAGMFLMALAYFVMFFAGRAGGDTGKVSPWWLIGCYALMGLAEITLSPMALSLVSKVAPARVRGLMMGLWFVATGVGGKLTQIGVYWTEWRHSTFFLVLASLSLATAFLLVFVLRPLKRAMPGV